MDAGTATWAVVGIVLAALVVHAIVTVALAQVAMRHGYGFRSVFRIRSLASFGWSLDAQDASRAIQRPGEPTEQLGKQPGDAITERTGGAMTNDI
jgi:hypothetical protein